MSTDDLMKLLDSRGLKVSLRPDGTPSLSGPRSQATTRLLAVLRLPVHRDEIVRRLTPVVKSVVVVETPGELVGPPEPCPRCGRALDSKARCWEKKCGWRRCEGGCGKATGSVFISLCILCEMNWRRTHGQG